MGSLRKLMLIWHNSCRKEKHLYIYYNNLFTIFNLHLYMSETVLQFLVNAKPIIFANCAGSFSFSAKSLSYAVRTSPRLRLLGSFSFIAKAMGCSICISACLALFWSSSLAAKSLCCSVCVPTRLVLFGSFLFGPASMSFAICFSPCLRLLCSVLFTAESLRSSVRSSDSL